MRKTLALFVLMVFVVAGWSGCSQSSPNQGAAPADKATTAPANPSTTTSNTATSANANKAPRDIKPPMKDEK